MDQVAAHFGLETAALHRFKMAGELRFMKGSFSRVRKLLVSALFQMLSL